MSKRYSIAYDEILLANHFRIKSCIKESFEIQMTGECLEKNAELFLDKYSTLLSENILLEPLDFTQSVEKRCNFLTKEVSKKAAIFYPTHKIRLTMSQKLLSS